MNKKRIYFGTDGMRGKVGEMPMSPEFIVKFGWALGSLVSNYSNPTVLIGKDTRISGYLIESALQAGLSAAGANILLLGPMPTPAVAYLTKKVQAAIGIVISASHNPYYDNGIKLFGSNGRKVSDEFEYAIEHKCVENLHVVANTSLGKASRMYDAAQLYETYLLETIKDVESGFDGIKCVIDCANGANYQIAPRLFECLGFKSHCINIHPNGLNINNNCGSTHVESLAKVVVEQRAAFGVAFDGDGDRVVFIDEQGEILDGDYILYLIAKYRQAKNDLSGGIVGTVMSNLCLEKAMDRLNIPFVRSAVGDRYVLEQLDQNGWCVGGEPSGHIINKDKLATGDGIITALQFLQAWLYFNKPLSSLRQEMVKFPQTIKNIKINHALNIEDFLNTPKIKKVLKGAESTLQDKGRLLVRKSGTESCLRLMVEAQTNKMVDSVISEVTHEISGYLSLVS